MAQKPNISDDRGVVYIASREPYLSEAETSARSVREHNPELSITLYAPKTADPAAVFDAVNTIDDPSHGFSDSNLTPERLPYERTLFLDSDTYVTGSLDSVFALLDEYEVAAAQDPTRTGTIDHGNISEAPDSFPQYNTGVLAVRNTEAVAKLLRRWSELYTELPAKFGLNQPSFRVALYESDVELATLPPEYNFRIGNVANTVLYACGPVRILHGRSTHWDPADAAARINASHDRRAVVAKPHPELILNDDRSPIEELYHRIDRVGWTWKRDGIMGLALKYGTMIRDKLVRKA